MNIKQFQAEVQEWAFRNFPNNLSYHCLLGAVEEIGELSHAHLKEDQQIRGSAKAHQLAAKDAVADCIIYLTDYCNRRGWDLDEILQETWEQVKQRDWTKNSHDGTANGPSNIELAS